MVFSVTRIDGSAMLRLSRGRELIRRSKYVSLNEVPQHWQVRRSFNTTAVKEQHPRSYHKGPTGRVRTGDHKRTNGIQFYAIQLVANLDKNVLVILEDIRLGKDSAQDSDDHDCMLPS